MSPNAIKKHQDAIEAEYKGLMQEEQQLLQQQNAIAERRNQIGQRVLNLQGQAQMAQMLLQEAKVEEERAASPLPIRRQRNGKGTAAENEHVAPEITSEMAQEAYEG